MYFYLACHVLVDLPGQFCGIVEGPECHHHPRR
jgi:hypothetical protein